jgi:hypothetical protein
MHHTMTSMKILHRWHKLLGLPRHSRPSWYRDQLRDELVEYRAARTPLEKLSETSDVFFALSRARHDGFPVRRLPVLRILHVPVYGYVLAKYTSRWGFYRVLALLCRAPHHATVREVMNPTKDHKLEEIASRHHIDPETFKRIGGRLRRVWPLFP